MINVCVICMVNRPDLSPLSAEHRTLLEAIVSPVINTAEIQAFHSQWQMCETCKLSMQTVYNFQQTALVGVKNLLLYLKTRQHETVIEETKPMEFVKVEPPLEVTTAASKDNLITIEATKNVNLLTEELIVKFEPEPPDYLHEPKDEQHTVSASHEPHRDTVSASHERGRGTVSASHEPDRGTVSASHEPDRGTESASHEPDRGTVSPASDTMTSTSHELGPPPHTQPQDSQQVTVTQQVRVRDLHQMRAPNTQQIGIRDMQVRAPNTQQIPVPYIQPVPLPNIHQDPVPYIQPFRVPNIHQDRVPYIQPVRVPNIHQDRVPYIQPVPVPNIHQDRVPYIQPVRVPNIHQDRVPYIPPVPVPNIHQVPMPYIQPFRVPNIHHQFQALPHTQQARVMPVGAEREGNFEVFTHRPQPEKTNYNYVNGVLTCPLCARPLMNKSAYVSHMKGHANRERDGPNKVRKKYIRKKPERVTCPQCDKSFGSNCGLKDHMIRSHGEISLCECDVCGKQYRNEYALKLHKYHHTKKEIQANRDPMETMRPELFCKECCLQFSGPAAYRQHRMTRKHTPKEHYKFECDTCKAKFLDKKRLQQHIEVVHLRQGAYKCDKCDRTYGSALSLRRHNIYVHEKRPRSKSKPTLVCHLCGKTFTIQKSLREHLLKHEGLRPHQCPLCPATFTYEAALYTHNRLKHLKIKRKRKKKVKEGVEKSAESCDGDRVKVKRKGKKKVKDGEENSADSGDGDGVKLKRKKVEKDREEKTAESYDGDGGKVKRNKKVGKGGEEDSAESCDSDGVKVKRKRKKKVKDGEKDSAESGDGDGVKIKRKKVEKEEEESAESCDSDGGKIKQKKVEKEGEEESAENYDGDGIGELLKII